MARGDITLFQEFAENIGSKDHDLTSDVLKLGIIDNTLTPLATIATPSWDDYSANEVSTAGGYIADGITLTTIVYTEAGGVATLDADDVALAQDALGFTDGYWGILYNSTPVGNLAIGFVDLGGPVSEQDGPISIAWNASGILTVTIS